MGVLRLQIMRVVVSELIVAEREGFEPSLLFIDNPNILEVVWSSD